MDYFAHFLMFLSVPLFFEGLVSYMRFSADVMPRRVEDEFFEADFNHHPQFKHFMTLFVLGGLSLILGALLVR